MSSSQREPLVRLTVNLVPRADTALTLVSQLTGDSKTDSVNRAIQVYAYIESVLARGGEFLVREDGETSKVILDYPRLHAVPPVQA